MSFDVSKKRKQAALVEKIDELQRTVGSNALLDLVTQYFARNVCPRQSPEITDFGNWPKKLPEDRYSIGMYPDAFDRLIAFYDDGKYAVGEDYDQRPPTDIDEIAMVLCAIRDAEIGFPIAIVEMADNDLWPRYYVIRDIAKNGKIPVGALDCLFRWASELEEYLREKQPLPEKICQTPRDDKTGFLGGRELREKLGVHPTRTNAFEQQLKRKRRTLGDENWIESQDPQPNRPKFLYRADAKAILDLAKQYQSPK